MGTIKGTIVCFCISFLAISWSGESLGVSASALPLHTHAIPSTRYCDCCYRTSPISQNPSYLSPSSTSLTALLKQLSTTNIDAQSNQAIQNQESVLLKNLVNRLESFKKSSAVATTPVSSLPAVSQTTYNSIENQYLEVRLLAGNLLNSRDAEVVQSALDALYKTFLNVITGQLLNTELPNLCSKTLDLNTQLTATDPPTELQDAVTDFIKSLTLALTGQSQVTILGLCECLNDLETSVVTVVENDESQRLQYLLSNLVDAVTNAVVSGGDVGCNVIDIVKQYVDSIKRATQEDANVRARQIYNSVLNFEEELYKVLIAPESTEITVLPSNGTTSLPFLKTEEEYLSDIRQLSEAIFGDSASLVESAVEILLDIKKLEDSAPGDEPTSDESSLATLENLKKVEDFLRSISSNPQEDSTDVIKPLVNLLSTLPDTTARKVLAALDPVEEDNGDTDPLVDATAIVSNGELFVLIQRVVQEIDNDGNAIDIVLDGTYQLVDPDTNVTWAGSYAVEDRTVQSDSSGNVSIKSYGVYDVNPPPDETSTSGTSRVKREATFELEDDVVVQVDENGYPIVTESGTYNLTDSSVGTSKSGNFIVENKIVNTNPDGTIEVIKSGLLYVNEPDDPSPSKQPYFLDGSRFILINDHIFGTPDSDGNVGIGRYNIKNPESDEYESGTYVIQQWDRNENPDGSVDYAERVLLYDNELDTNSDSNIFNGVGSQYTFNDHINYVRDKYEHVSPISTGEFTTTNPQTGRTTSGDFLFQNVIITENSDGSKEITKFGNVFNISVTTPNTESTTTPSSFLDPTQQTTESTMHWPISKNDFTSLISSLNPVKSIQPAASSSTTESPSSTSPTINTYFDATSVVTNGTTFIIDGAITPLLDPEGNVIGDVTMGTYHFTDTRTNTSWFGSFEVEDSSIKMTSPGNLESMASGTFTAISYEEDGVAEAIGNFSIKDLLSQTINEYGTTIASEEGTYSVTDLTTGSFKTGTYVVENTISKQWPGGGVELIKSGILFVDESDSTTTPPIEEPLIPGYDEYLLFDEHISNTRNGDGNYGTGLYSAKDSKSDALSSGSYVIENVSITNNPNGTVDRKIEGVIYVDGSDPNSNSDGSVSPFIFKNGATFTIDDHEGYPTLLDDHVTSVGNGRYTQIDPETGVPETTTYVLLNVVTIDESDGTTIIRKFAVVPTEGESDLGTDAQSPTTIFDSSPPLVLKPGHLETLINSLNPVHSAPGSGAQLHSTSTNGNPIQDATAIATNGSYFIINGQIVTQRDDEGKLIGRIEKGEYGIRNPVTNISWTGSFDVEDFSIESITDDQSDSQTEITASGTFDVNLPIDNSSSSPNTKIQANFAVDDLLTVIVDETGTSSVTENGSYSLIDPNTGDSRTGDYVVTNRISKMNSDGTIDIVKSGILYAGKAPEPTASSGQSSAVEYGGYLLTNQNVFPVADSNGNYGSGEYNIKDLETNEQTTGDYLIQETSTVINPDGSQVVTTAGLIFVDPSRSTSTSTNTDPSLVIVDGAQFKFVDHVSSTTDAYGRIHVVGTGEFTQVDPKTNTSTSVEYVIQDIINNDDPDGSQQVIKTGMFYYPTDSSTTTSTSTDDTTASSSADLSSDPTLANLETSLQALISHLEELKKRTNPVSSTGDSATTLGSTPLISSGISYPQITSSSVVLQRSNVVSAISGQCLEIGDVVVVQANSGAVLVAKIQDSCGPVTFYVTNLADLTRIFETANKVWSVQENDFSKQDRRLIDGVSSLPSPPCNS